jgi:hypothetical protein
MKTLTCIGEAFVVMGMMFLIALITLTGVLAVAVAVAALLIFAVTGGSLLQAIDPAVDLFVLRVIVIGALIAAPAATVMHFLKVGSHE